jgi:uncharacterized protein with GYD domain
MPTYLSRFSYTPEATKALVHSPQDRAKSAAESAAALGVEVKGFWYALGEFDGVLLAEAPNNAAMAALAMLVGQSGTLSRFETTALLDMSEAQDAMRAAAGASFTTPMSASH